MYLFGLIQSMIKSVQNEMSKWLAERSQPLSDSFSTYCISESFKFSTFIRNSGIGSCNRLLVSFDIVNLNTNVDLQDTLNVLYRGPIESCINSWSNSGVEFSFDENTYAQIDGLSMSSPLNPVLANMFVGYYESLLFEKKKKKLVNPMPIDVTSTTHSPSLNL